MKKNHLIIVVLVAGAFALNSCQSTNQSGTTASSTETKTEKKESKTEKKASTDAEKKTGSASTTEKPGTPGAKASATPKGAGGRLFGDADDAKVITKEEAEKSYPPPSGGYPSGDLTAAGGICRSPYPPYKKYRANRGAYVVDTAVDKVFVAP